MKYALLFLSLLWSGIVPSSSTATESKQLTLTSETGVNYQVGGAAKKELLLLFLSFNCPACKKSLPHLEAIQKKAGPKMQLLGAIFPPEEKNLLSRAKELKIPFPLVPGNNAVAKEYGVEKIPTLIWLDRQGRIRERFIGEARLQQLSECLSRTESEMCSGLIELSARPKDFIGKKVVTSGILVAAKTEKGKTGHFYLSNGKEKIEVLPWLPRELPPKAPGATPSEKAEATPKTMQQFLGKLVTVRGQLQAGSLLKVESASILETQKTWKNPPLRRD